jgi:hypothetical protein
MEKVSFLQCTSTSVSLCYLNFLVENLKSGGKFRLLFWIVAHSACPKTLAKQPQKSLNSPPHFVFHPWNFFGSFLGPDTKCICSWRAKTLDSPSYWEFVGRPKAGTNCPYGPIGAIYWTSKVLGSWPRLRPSGVLTLFSEQMRQKLKSLKIGRPTLSGRSYSLQLHKLST